MNLEDKVVLITGAGSGIGAATTELLCSHGAMVIAGDIDKIKVEKITKKLPSAKGVSIAKELDVTQFEEFESCVDWIVATYGKLDILVNNAGIGGKYQKKTAEHTLEDWHDVIAVNQTGVFYGLKIALTQMTKQGYGNIVNVSSLAGLKPTTYNLSYCASKFAVVGMTKSSAKEYAHKNIRINAICPGYTESPLLDKLLSVRPDMEDRLKRTIPMNRFGKPKEIAEAIAWLVSDRSNYITGQALTLDGGTSLI